MDDLANFRETLRNLQRSRISTSEGSWEKICWAKQRCNTPANSRAICRGLCSASGTEINFMTKALFVVSHLVTEVNNQDGAFAR